MKILYAFYTMGYHNTYPYDLYDEIKKFGIEASMDLKEFWNPDYKNYDIIHFHWPDSLLEWREPNGNDLKHLEDILDHWKKKGTKFITTRHNFFRHLPENASDQTKKNFEFLYEIIYAYSDGIIHLGKFSVSDFENRHPYLFRGKQHVVIPHGIYRNYPNNSSRQQARRKLNLGEKKKIILVFGTIRTDEEVDFILEVFKKLKIPGKLLLAPRWKFSSNRVIKRIKKAYFQLNGNYRISNQIISNQDIQYYMNAADIIFIPRINNLNSGVLILSYSFGKVVVGPNFGNIGEIIRETNNYIYDPSDVPSALKALTDSLTSNVRAMGQKNYDYAIQNWNWDLLGKSHINFYEKILNS